MFNPILDIPFVLNTMITALIVWGGYAIGFFKPEYVLLLSVLPIGMREFLSSMSWHNVLIPVIALVVGLVVRVSAASYSRSPLR